MRGDLQLTASWTTRIANPFTPIFVLKAFASISLPLIYIPDGFWGGGLEDDEEEDAKGSKKSHPVAGVFKHR